MKKNLVVFAILSLATSLFAQKTAYYKGFELSGSASLGINALSFSNEAGNRYDGPGAGLGIGVAFFTNAHWGISTGLSFSNYTSFATFPNNYVFTNYTVDSDGQPMNLNFTLNKVKEIDVAYQMALPLMIHYRHYLRNGNALFLSGGVKMSFPLGSTYRVTSGSVTTTGYYPSLNAEMSNLPWLGFTTNDIKGLNGTTSFRKTYMSSFEIGYLVKEKKNTFLTLSLYGDLGLNNLRKNYTATPLMYNYFQYAGLPGSNFVDQVKLYAVGLKISWNINLSGGAQLPAVDHRAKQTSTKSK